MIIFKKVEHDYPWDEIESSQDSTIYKTKEWFDHLYGWRNLKPFIVEISEKNKNIIGYFIGVKIKMTILSVIGSPFEGLGTAHQGLSMLKDISVNERILLYNKLAKWIFLENQGVFLQVEDWKLTMTDVEGTDLTFEAHDGYVIDLEQDEDVLFKNLHPKSCRYSIRKSERMGVTIRETIDVDNFINIYYDQLLDVFSKQDLKPTYGKECVESLVRSLYPNRILLLEAVTKEGKIIATGLFPGDNNLAVFWGGASYHEFQKFCPNEPLVWEAIKLWKNRGTKKFDLCGIRPYKLKFGPILYTKPRIIFSKYSFLPMAKRWCKKIYYEFKKIEGKF